MVVHPRRRSLVALTCLVVLAQLPVSHGQKQLVDGLALCPQFLGSVKRDDCLLPDAVAVTDDAKRVQVVWTCRLKVHGLSGMFEGLRKLAAGWVSVLGQPPGEVVMEVRRLGMSLQCFAQMADRFIDLTLFRQ